MINTYPTTSFKDPNVLYKENDAAMLKVFYMW